MAQKCVLCKVLYETRLKELMWMNPEHTNAEGFLLLLPLISLQTGFQSSQQFYQSQSHFSFFFFAPLITKEIPGNGEHKARLWIV